MKCFETRCNNARDIESNKQNSTLLPAVWCVEHCLIHSAVKFQIPNLHRCVYKNKLCVPHGIMQKSDVPEDNFDV